VEVMQIQLPIVDKHGEPIYKNINKVIAMYVSKDKKIKFYRVPFVMQGVWIHVTVNNRTFVVTKKQICWRKVKKRIKFKKYVEWEAYVLIMDSKAYENMMP